MGETTGMCEEPLDLSIGLQGETTRIEGHLSISVETCTV